MSDAFQLPKLVPLTPKLARLVLSKLRDGTSPPGAVEHLWVDRGGWAAKMSKQLDRVAEDDLTDLRIATGEYGSGKSHALAAIATLALSKNWAVSRLRFADTDGLDSTTMFHLIARNLIVAERIKGKDADAANAYMGISQDGTDWLFRHEARKLLKKHTKEPLPAQSADRALARLIESASLPISASRALSAFCRAEWDGSTDLRNAVSAWWLNGEPMRRPVALEKQTNGMSMIGALARIVRAFGYPGLLVTIDEVEDVRKLAPKKRSAAWENLRAQIDFSEAPGLMLVLALATAGLTGKEGPEENDALASRLRVAKRAALDPEKKFDPNATILALDKLKFSEGDLRSVARQLRGIFAEGFGKAETRLEDGEIDQITQDVIEEAGRAETDRCRTLVQMIVQVLNERREDGDFSLDGLRETIRDVIRREPRRN